MKISVQQEDFDLGLEVLEIQQDNRIGAVASFVGQVREVPMTLEHYPGMTENAIKKIVDEARARWKILDLAVIHRFGDLQPGDRAGRIRQVDDLDPGTHPLTQVRKQEDFDFHQ